MADSIFESGKGIQATNFVIETSIYSLEVIKKAAYCFLDQATFEFKAVGEKVECQVSFNQPLAEKEVIDFKKAFDTELLDQDLRQTVSNETESMRNAVLAYAFSRTGLQSE